MSELTIRSTSNPPFHLDLNTWPDGVTQLVIVSDGISHEELDRATGALSAGLAIQLNPDQIRELVDYLEPHAAKATPGLLSAAAPDMTPIEEAFGLTPATISPLTPEMMASLGLDLGTHETILDEAQRIVHGPRRASYGHPARNFGRIAELWNAYIAGKDGSKDLDATDVAMMMILLKMARILHSKADRDGHTDIVGYAACSAIINGIDPS